MPALIERHHVKSAGERGRHVIEPVRVRRAPVQEADDGSSPRFPLEKAQSQSVHLDETSPRALASEVVSGR
jgi:hypothetical protein